MSRKRDRRIRGVDKGFAAVPSPDDSVPQDDDSIPVDLGAVRADDEFIEALLSKPIVPTRTQADYELAWLLSTWRDDVASEPIGRHPTLEAVEAGIAAAARRHDTQRRSFRIARYAGGAVAAVALVFGGVSAVAHNAAPGDPLWGVKEVMFGADASSTLAMADVEASIERAAEAFVTDDKSAAKKHLEAAELLLKDVRDAGDRAALERQIDKLRSLLDPVPNTAISGSVSSSAAQVPPTITASPPLETVTVPPETVTITPSETVVSEPPPPPSSSEPEPPPTIVSEPQSSEPPPPPPPVSTPSSEVPVVPPG